MLFTPRLYVMAEEKDIKLSLESDNIMHTMAAYADMCYCAALNHWTLDNDIEAFQFKRADFHEWSASNPKEFSRVMIMAAEAISGKTMKEMMLEKQKVGTTPSQHVKKKQNSNAIIRWLRRFLSVIAE